MVRAKQFRLVLAFVGAFPLAGTSFATPIKPDLGKILNQQRPRHFAPARAGWYGPEMPQAAEGSLNPTLEAYGPAATARTVRAALTTAAIPDPKAVLAIGVLILLMRALRMSQDQRRTQGIVVPMRTSAENRKAA